MTDEEKNKKIQELCKRIAEAIEIDPERVRLGNPRMADDDLKLRRPIYIDRRLIPYLELDVEGALDSVTLGELTWDQWIERVANQVKELFRR